MQRLEVSGAVRPLKWPLGVKWLRFEFCVFFSSVCSAYLIHFKLV
jgi:hypothetical protein